MSELGDVLELMHGARHRFRTVRATIREWQHFERSGRAFERHIEQTSATAYAMAAGPASETLEGLVRLWFAKPGRIREEREGPLGGPSVGVRDGERWWMYSPEAGAMSNEGGPSVQSGVGDSAEPMLDPAPLIGFLELEPLGRSERAGRTGIAARARPRPDDRRYGFQLHVLGLGADDYELLVDAERGILLRTVARLDGEDFHVREMAEIAFDEEFPPETFVFVPPPGEEIRPVGTRLPRRQLMIEQAVALAPFPLWIPSRLPPGRWEMEVHHFPGEERPRVTESVWIHYHLEDASHQINLQETAAREAETPEVLDWQVVRHGEDEFLVVEIEHPGGQVAIQVRAERDGTTVTLSSDLERETVLALAESLAPAPAEPPRL